MALAEKKPLHSWFHPGGYVNKLIPTPTVRERRNQPSRVDTSTGLSTTDGKRLLPGNGFTYISHGR
jgi:hypothetical protein